VNIIIRFTFVHHGVNFGVNGLFLIFIIKSFPCLKLKKRNIMSRQGQLAYSFAKRHGVLLVKQGETQEQGLLLREDVKLASLMEVRRVFGSLVVHETLPLADFNQRLATAYQGDAGESQQAVDGLEDHPDLESLAESMPETEDLMEQEDDAPIIRLINALLSEAIRLSL
jgi:general secretion pathway protein E